MLLDAALDLASTRELRPLLQVLLDHFNGLVDYAGTSVWELQGHEGRIGASLVSPCSAPAHPNAGHRDELDVAQARVLRSRWGSAMRPSLESSPH